MAKPENPLDKFGSYTYYFELHAAPSWDELKDLAISDLNTDRFSPNNTMLINGRKDAHQVIEDVQFMVMGTGGSKTEILTAYGNLTMKIIEGGGFGFLEKLNRTMIKHQVTELSNLQFMLRIMFVGRTTENAIETIPIKPIPLVLIPGSTAMFDQKGGVYMLTFGISSALAATSGRSTGSQMRFSFVNRSIGIKATTLQEGFQQLEKGLNEHYKDIYSKDLSSIGRKITYKINPDSRLKGRLADNSVRDFSPGSPVLRTFNPGKEIATYINDLLMMCPDVMDQIGASKPSLKSELHKGAFFPYVVPRVHYKGDEIEITYDINIYEGGKDDSKYEFEYFFTEAGKNVDITSYEVKFNDVSALLQNTSTTSTQGHTNIGANKMPEHPKEHARYYHENEAQAELYREVNRMNTNYKKNDINVQPEAAPRDRMGFNNVPFNNVPTLRLATETLADFKSAINSSQTMEIRGHLKLLQAMTPDPTGTEAKNFSSGESLWIKVNIYMPTMDENGTITGKTKFYYNGYYQVITINNIFGGGQFKQQITMQAIDGK